MKELLQHVIIQLDKLDEKLADMNGTMIKQEENLREHMRRTDILEKRQEVFQTQMHDEIEPIKSHVEQVKGITKFILAAIPILAAIAGAAYTYLM